jgi:hypothetical protein
MTRNGQGWMERRLSLFTARLLGQSSTACKTLSCVMQIALLPQFRPGAGPCASGIGANRRRASRTGGGFTTKVSLKTSRTVANTHYVTPAGTPKSDAPLKNIQENEMSRLLVASSLCLSLAASGFAFAQTGTAGAAGTSTTGSTMTPSSGSADNGMVATPKSSVDSGINASGSGLQQSPNGSASSSTNGTMSPGSASGSVNSSGGAMGSGSMGGTMGATGAGGAGDGMGSTGAGAMGAGSGGVGGGSGGAGAGAGGAGGGAGGGGGGGG